MCVCVGGAGGRELRPQANNMEFEILAGVVIEHGSLITGLPGWPAITMTYHRAEELGVYNKILRHDKHCPEETHTTICIDCPNPGHPALVIVDSLRSIAQVELLLKMKKVLYVFYLLTCMR